MVYSWCLQVNLFWVVWCFSQISVSNGHLQPQEVGCSPAFTDYDCTCHMIPGLFIKCRGLNTWPEVSSADMRVDTLDLSNNRLTGIPSGAFGSMYIRNLDLSQNLLTNEYLFEDVLRYEQASSLRSVDLSFNKLLMVPLFLEDITSLRSLDLRGNEWLTFLTNRELSYLTHLKELYLPKIFVLDNHALDHDHLNLQVLEISPQVYLDMGKKGTLAEMFGPYNIDNLQNLKILIIYSGLFIIDTPSMISRFHNLRHLEIIDSRINDINMNRISARELINLHILSLAGNYLNFIPVTFLQDSPDLEDLDLSRNSIDTVGGSDFMRNTNLMVINLQNNNISSITGEPFKNLINLIELNLANNRITSVHALAFPDHFMHGMVLHLGNNPFDCHCDIWWLMQLSADQMEGEPGPLDLFEVANEMVCSSTYGIQHTTTPLYEAVLPYTWCSYN